MFGNKNKLSARVLNRAIQNIHANTVADRFLTDIDPVLEDVAEACGITKEELSKQCSKMLGKTVAAYAKMQNDYFQAAKKVAAYQDSLVAVKEFALVANKKKQAEPAKNLTSALMGAFKEVIEGGEIGDFIDGLRKTKEELNPAPAGANAQA